MASTIKSMSSSCRPSALRPKPGGLGLQQTNRNKNKGQAAEDDVRREEVGDHEDLGFFKGSSEKWRNMKGQGDQQFLLRSSHLRMLLRAETGLRMADERPCLYLDLSPKFSNSNCRHKHVLAPADPAVHAARVQASIKQPTQGEAR